jgi:hypothetical protein
MKEYTVVFGTRHDNAVGELIENVNSKISEGWTPLGGVALNTSYGFFFQAMILE